MTSSTSPTISGSSAEVGSSKSMTSGSIASARTIARRCFWPPDRRVGLMSRLSDRPTRASSASASAMAASLLFLPSSVGARVMLSMTDMCGKMLKCWKTMPIFWRCLSMSTDLSAMSTPSNQI